MESTSNKLYSINSPFWVMGNMDAITEETFLTLANPGNLRSDWIEYTGDTIVSHKSVDLSIRQLVYAHDKYIKNIFINESPFLIIKFLENELLKLNMPVKRESFRYYKQKLQKFEKLTKNFPLVTMSVLKERCFWYQRLNMFILGTHKYAAGRRYTFILERMLQDLKQDGKLSHVSRRKLLAAFSYIFQNEKHKSFNYKNVLDDIKYKFLKFKQKLRK